MLWVDKYRPKTLSELDYHLKLTNMIKKMVSAGNFPHLLFYGPSGGGKKTRVLALLNQVFGKSVNKIKTEHKQFKVRSKTIEITTLGSNYHIEMNPCDAGIYDRIVVQDIIKEIASSALLTSSSNNNLDNSNNNNNNISFKVVILNEVDKLTKDAQHGLRRTMEKYMKTCRLILICSSISKVIEPLRSRCLSIRVSLPTHDEIVSILLKISKLERINLGNNYAKKIAIKSKRNLRKAILMLQSCSVETTQLIDDENNNNNNDIKCINITPWEIFIKELARIIIEEQTPKRLLLARNKLYELLSNCIPEDIIFEKLTLAILENIDDELRHIIIKWSAFHQHRMKQGSKAIIHLEAFLAKVMSEYKQYTANMFNIL